MKLLSQAGDVPIKGLHRLRFDADMESEYQVAVAEHKRIPRLLLFAFLGLCFALAPFYQIDFFDVASTADIWLRKFEIYAVGPLSLAAALATYLRQRKLLTSLIQSVAVVVLWVSPLFLRYLALHGAMQYPGSMVGIVVIAIAIFGGFNWYIFSLGSVIVLAVAAVQELTFGGSTTQVWLDINALALTGLIAVLGAYAIEVSHRLAWANGHTAYLLARTDALTGLSTRTDFDRSFPGLLQQARRDQRGIAIALIDVDHFDTINESHGRSVGDEVLGALGLGLRTRLVRRPFDMAVRFTGDRMLVLWFAVPQEARQQLAATITEVLKAVSLTLPNGRTVTITASCGISWLIPDKASSPAEILRDTECLMDQARTEGRNRIQVG